MTLGFNKKKKKKFPIRIRPTFQNYTSKSNKNLYRNKMQYKTVKINDNNL